MPVRVMKDKNKFCVEDASGKRYGCHDKHTDAAGQARAINMQMHDKALDEKAESFPLPDVETGEKKKPFSQNDTNYITVASDMSQMCANCRFFKSREYDPCWIVEPYPDPILPTGWCNQWVAREPREQTPTVERHGDSVTVNLNEAQRAYEEDESDEEEKPKKKEEKGLWEKAVDLIRSKFDSPQPDIIFDLPQGFKLHPEDDNRWLGWWTNNFEDRDKQLFSSKAIDRYVKLVQDGEWPMPELWFGHIKGTRHGVADAVVKMGHFVLATGTFDDPAKNWLVPHMKQFYRDAKSVEMSHGFYYDKNRLTKDGVYDAFLTFELTSLPPGWAANPYTTFDEVNKMDQISEKERTLLQQANFSDEFIARLENGAAMAGERLTEQGVRFKDAMGGEEEPEQDAKMEGDMPKKKDEGKDKDKEKDDMKKSSEPDATPEPDYATAIKAQNDQIEALTTQVNALQKSIELFVNMTPRGSRSQETKLDANEQMKQAMFGDQSPNVDNAQMTTGGKSFFDYVTAAINPDQGGQS